MSLPAIVPPLNLTQVGGPAARNKWPFADTSRARKGWLLEEDLGYTTLANGGANGGAVTTRCRPSNGWETPFQIDPSLTEELVMTRSAPTPARKTRESVSFEADAQEIIDAGFRSTYGAMVASYAGHNGMQDRQRSLTSRAWIGQQARRNCPFATDRRFVGGDYLYRTSYLHKSVPVTDRNYLEVYSKRPVSSRKLGFSRFRHTQQIIATINQKMYERSKSNNVSSRTVDSKHPMRVFMSSDTEHKGYLNYNELLKALEQFNVDLIHDEYDRLMLAFPHAIGRDQEDENFRSFDYMAFLRKIHTLPNIHPLGGYAGHSWGWKTEGPS